MSQYSVRRPRHTKRYRRAKRSRIKFSKRKRLNRSKRTRRTRRKLRGGLGNPLSWAAQKAEAGLSKYLDKSRAKDLIAF